MILFIVCMVLWILQTAECSVLLSVNRTTTQSSNYTVNGTIKYTSENAVDGITKQALLDGSCIHQAVNMKEVWWRVDLGREVAVEKVDIYYREERYNWKGWKKRFAGYKLYLSNITDRTEQGLCYSDNTSSVNDVRSYVSHTCRYTARYIIIYNQRQNKYKKWYDDDALLELCEVQVYGCDTGKYGNGNCNENCSSNCPGQLCEPDTGACQYCGPNTYESSSKCLPCSEYCEGHCDKNGHCIACVAGKYGDTCDKDCHYKCKVNVCNKITGSCDSCESGFCPQNCLGNNCNFAGICSECFKGKYGDTCSHDCRYKCMGNVCNMTNGYCDACEPGYFGKECNSCPHNCLRTNCDFDGICSGCINGYYGDQCETSCPVNCTICEQHRGRCSECLSGHYGDTCSESCGHCKDKACNIDTGSCKAVCIDGWTGDKCNMKVDSQVDNSSSNMGMYAGAGVGALVVIAVIVVIIFVIIKRKSSRSSKRPASQEPSVIFSKPCVPSKTLNNTGGSNQQACVNLDVENGIKKDKQESVYYNEGPFGFPITNLKVTVAKKMENNEEDFHNEFHTFPHGAVHPHKAGGKNMAKNRFKSVFPYDHSRVILDPVPGGNTSDYINASFIDSVESRQLYVATQGPLPSTIDDFWRMIWQLNTGKIVMLTNLYEKNKKKCHKYWPDEGQPLSTETFEICMNRERDYASHVVRHLSIVHKKTKVTREVHQFHFTTWPDHGTPDTLELVLFHRRVNLFKTELQGQIVIHCSAGIGRTGTFIALDALLEYGKKYQHIDVNHYATTMRKDRMNMIQTQEQYVALHEILIEAFDLQDTLIPNSTFFTKFKSLSVSVQPNNKMPLRNEFEVMLELKPKYTSEDFCVSTLSENQEKNRTTKILAADRYRAFLTSHPSKRNDYINAVITPSYINRQGFLVTQFPLPATRVDFWTMIIDYHSDTLVILGDEHETGHESRWIPQENEELVVDHFKLCLKGEKSEIGGIDVIDVSVTGKDIKTAVNIRVLRMRKWTEECTVPPANHTILQLLEQVEGRRRSGGNKPVVVTCNDGSTQCGLFCLMSNTRDQLKMDEEVDVLQAARQLLIRRPEFIASFDQYQYCYHILNDYLEATNVYIN